MTTHISEVVNHITYSGVAQGETCSKFFQVFFVEISVYEGMFSFKRTG